MATWVFGYGSLLWRTEFPFQEKVVAHVDGWERRFDQGSPDHRGTPDRLGRVVTLVRAPGRRCAGMAYRVLDEEREALFAALDHRERGGYERAPVEAILSGRESRVSATTWIAPPENRYYLGAASLEEVVAQIRGAAGPSGANVEYVLRLADMLHALGMEDPHVAEIAARLRDEALP